MGTNGSGNNNQETFDLNQVFTKDVFTIPVELVETDDLTGDIIKRKVLVTYKFGKDNKDVFARKEGQSYIDQLESLLVRIRGGGNDFDKSVLTKDYIAAMRDKHVIQIVEAISNDIYPNMKTSIV